MRNTEAEDRVQEAPRERKEEEVEGDSQHKGPSQCWEVRVSCPWPWPLALSCGDGKGHQQSTKEGCAVPAHRSKQKLMAAPELGEVGAWGRLGKLSWQWKHHPEVRSPPASPIKARGREFPPLSATEPSLALCLMDSVRGWRCKHQNAQKWPNLGP